MGCVQLSHSYVELSNESELKLSVSVTCPGHVEVRVETDVNPYSTIGPVKLEGSSYVLTVEGEGRAWATFLFPRSSPFIKVKVYYESQLVDEVILNPKECVDATARPSGNGKVVGLIVENLCDKEVEVPIKVVGEGAVKYLKKSVCVEKVAELSYVDQCVERVCIKWRYVETCAKKRVVCINEKCSERCKLKVNVPVSCEEWRCVRTQRVPIVKYKCARYKSEVMESSWAPSGKEGFEGSLRLGPHEVKALRFVFKGGVKRAKIGGSEVELLRPSFPPLKINYLPILISIAVIVFSLSLLLTS